MRVLCLFFACRWLHLFNANARLVLGGPRGGLVGVYQCMRCKTVSTGRVQ